MGYTVDTLSWMTNDYGILHLIFKDSSLELSKESKSAEYDELTERNCTPNAEVVVRTAKRIKVDSLRHEKQSGTWREPTSKNTLLKQR